MVVSRIERRETRGVVLLLFDETRRKRLFFTTDISSHHGTSRVSSARPFTRCVVLFSFSFVSRETANVTDEGTDASIIITLSYYYYYYCFYFFCRRKIHSICHYARGVFGRVPLRRGYRVGRVGAPVHGGWTARSRGRIRHGSESVTRRRRREDDGSRRRFFRMFGGE